MMLVLPIAAVALRRANARVGVELRAGISRALLSALYRGVRLDRRLIVWLTLVFVGMLVAWTLLPPSGPVSADLVGWIGIVVALEMHGSKKEIAGRA